MQKCIAVLILVISSAISKVIITEEHLEVSNVLKDTNTKAQIFIELPTFKPPDISDHSGPKVELTESEHTTTPIRPNKCDTANDLDGELNTISEECNTEIKKPALILTPFIENGEIEKARHASEVDPTLFLGVESYSGFFTVNKTYDSNMFFWYFPVENKPVNETPWIIWLQGGPGASSLTGLFDEIGPIKVDKFGVLKRNQYSWIQNHSLLFIDNPVGTGYSFTNHIDGLARDMPTYSRHLYSTVKQFLEVFPELKTAPLYIAGESYAGKYVPALGMQLHRHKSHSQIDVNLQGFMLGNAYIEPAMIKNVMRPFYYFGLVNKEQLQTIDPLVRAFQADIDANKSVAAKQKWMQIITVLLLLSHQKQGYNFLKDDLGVGGFVHFLNSSEVQNAIHVGDIKYSFVNFTVNTEMGPDFLSSSRGLLEELLESYRVLSYCGHLDQLLPCIFSAENHRTWQWTNSKEFIDSKRRPYHFQKRLAGYFKTGGGFTEVVIRGAGHMVPVDEPARIQTLVTNWIQNLPIPSQITTHNTMIEELFMKQIINNNTLIYF